MRVKIQLEISLKTSAKIVFDRISTPGGLSEWYADNVNIKNNEYTFIWGKEERKAELVAIKQDRLVKFRWLDGDENDCFEFRLVTHELTRDLSLFVTDVVKENDKEEANQLWDQALNELKRILGV